MQAIVDLLQPSHVKRCSSKLVQSNSYAVGRQRSCRRLHTWHGDQLSQDSPALVGGELRGAVQALMLKSSKWAPWQPPLEFLAAIEKRLGSSPMAGGFHLNFKYVCLSSTASPHRLLRRLVLQPQIVLRDLNLHPD